MDCCIPSKLPKIAAFGLTSRKTYIGLTACFTDIRFFDSLKKDIAVVTDSLQTRNGIVIQQEWCQKVTHYAQDKFCSATEWCEANLALRDVKNFTTRTVAFAVSCSLARASRVSCAVY